MAGTITRAGRNAWRGRKQGCEVGSDLVDGEVGKEGKEGGGSDLERSRGWQGRQGRCREWHGRHR